MSLLSCLVFCKDCFENDTLHLVYAGVFDVALSSLCLSLLLWAETMRCCEIGPECCGSFGSRIYGGLGNIEPFTALIALRVFRFQFGRLVRKMFKRNVAGDCGRTSHLGSASTTKSVRAKQKSLVSEHTGLHIKARHHFAHETGTAVDLWKTAVGLYPEIAEKHGEFSSELLQAMLGLDDEKH